MRRITNWGGIAASVILVAFGIGALAMGLAGRDTVSDSLKQEQIAGTPDMTPSAIRAEAGKAGLKGVDIPTASVAGKSIDTADEARTFAQYMRIHTFEATDGLTYAQMGRFLDKNGKQTNDAAAAATDPKTHQPVENGLRNLWVTETALTTALNMSFMASQLALFSIVVGFALLLSGIGFTILALAVLGNAFRRESAKATVPKFVAPTPA
jgi:hypothetical protein